MEFSSSLYFMAINPNHSDFSQTAYNSDEPIYVWKDNMVYKRIGVWQRDFRNWLRDNGIDIDNDNNHVYTPVAHVKDDILTGYHTQYPNIANRFLEINQSVRETHYPNLYYVQIGNHPYPKEARYSQAWLEDCYHRECHRIVYPDSDPKKFFFLPKDILP